MLSLKQTFTHECDESQDEFMEKLSKEEALHLLKELSIENE